MKRRIASALAAFVIAVGLPAPAQAAATACDPYGQNWLCLYSEPYYVGLLSTHPQPPDNLANVCLPLDASDTDRADSAASMMDYYDVILFDLSTCSRFSVRVKMGPNSSIPQLSKTTLGANRASAFVIVPWF
jgi:hypothetical protein